MPSRGGRTPPPRLAIGSPWRARAESWDRAAPSGLVCPTPISSSRPGGHLRTPKDSYGHFGAPYGPIFGPELCHRTRPNRAKAPVLPEIYSRSCASGTSWWPSSPTSSTIKETIEPFPAQAFDGLRVKNAGRASIAGAELELTWLPAGHLSVHLGYGYLSARFDDFLVGSLASGEIRRDGYHLPNTPRHSLNAAATYSIPLRDDARILVQADYAWNDHQFLDSSNLPRSFQDAYGVFNASIAWISPGESWKVTAWGKNLSDELYADSRYGFLGSAWAHYAAPRTYGVSIQWNLG